MFNGILKFLGIMKEEPTFTEKVSSFIVTNATGMIVGACVTAAIIGLVCVGRKIRRNRKTNGDGKRPLMERIKLAIICKGAKVMGKLVKPKRVMVKGS